LLKAHGRFDTADSALANPAIVPRSAKSTARHSTLHVHPARAVLFHPAAVIDKHRLQNLPLGIAKVHIVDRRNNRLSYLCFASVSSQNQQLSFIPYL
jgi:hypothetical protein